MKVTLDDHSDEVLSALDAAMARGLEKCGLVAEGYAKKLCPVDTGNLRNSITHTVKDVNEQAAYVGSNAEYVAYVSLARACFIPVGDKRPGCTRMRKATRI